MHVMWNMAGLLSISYERVSLSEAVYCFPKSVESYVTESIVYMFQEPTVTFKTIFLLSIRCDLLLGTKPQNRAETLKIYVPS